MKLFVIRNKFDKFQNTAFTKEESAKKYVENTNAYRGENYLIYEEFDFDFIGRSVCYIEVYKGFRYVFGGYMYSIIEQSGVFSCADNAKASDFWKRYLELAESDPQHHIIKDDTVASIDPFDGEEFVYGDADIGLFNMKIKRIKIVKE